MSPNLGYEFAATENKSKEKIQTVIIKIKGETYCIKIGSPTTIASILQDTISIKIEIINCNIHKTYTISAVAENNKNDTAESLMNIFKKEIITALKDFIKTKKAKLVLEEFCSKLDTFSLTEDDIAVEEL